MCLVLDDGDEAVDADVDGDDGAEDEDDDDEDEDAGSEIGGGSDGADALPTAERDRADVWRRLRGCELSTPNDELAGAS